MSVNQPSIIRTLFSLLTTVLLILSFYIKDGKVLLLSLGLIAGLLVGVCLFYKVFEFVRRKWQMQTNGAFVKMSPDTFRDMREAAEALFDFLQALDRKHTFQTMLNETSGLEAADTCSGVFSINARFALLVFCDLRDVFTRLGHKPTSLHNREGIGYAMINYLLLKTEMDLSWLADRDKQGKLLTVLEESLRTEKSHIDIEGHENELRFAVLFGQRHHENAWVTQYATLLYRWASLVARANGVIEAAESNVLQSLIELKSKTSVSGNVRVSGSDSPIAEGLDALKDLIGLEPVKAEIRNLASFITIQRQREKTGLRAAPVSYHCVFTGNPGTGKTTVARIVAEIYRDMGIVRKGHLIETDRSGLIGEYVGQTAVKTNKIIDSALDGILFIDEAYSLVQGGEKDYGREAIATLLKRMEDDRERLVVILAGYTNEMKAFIDSNPGLQSRFNRYIEFPDYNAEELAQIFLKKTEACQYTCNRDVRASIVDIMQRAVEAKDRNFGNGRFVRNLFESAIQRQAVRLATQSPLTAEMLSELTLHDLGFTYDN